MEEHPHKKITEQMRNEEHGDPAKFTLRVSSLVIDIVLIAIILKLVGSSINTDQEGSIGIYLDGTGVFVAILYYFLTDWLLKGSIGKKVLSLEVCDEYGSRLSIGLSAFRVISRALTFITFFLGYATMFIRDDARALHDAVSNTYVLRKAST